MDFQLEIDAPVGAIVVEDESAIIERQYGVDFDPCLRCKRPASDCPCEKGKKDGSTV